MLKLGILIDATAEVPQAVLDNPHVRLLPIKIQMDGQTFIDARVPNATRDFNSQFLNLRAAEVSQSVAPSEAEIRQFFLERIACDFDHVFGLFVMGSRSPIFKNAMAAASKCITDSMPVRNKVGIKGPLFVECYDSMNALGGYGTQVMETLREFDTETSMAAIRNHMQELSGKSYTYVAPSNLDFILTRAKAKGDNSVGKLGAMAAKVLGIMPVLRGFQGHTEAVAKQRGVPAAQDYVFNITRRELQRGLLAPFVNMSYSGNVEDVLRMPQYRVLKTECEAKNVQLNLQEMSPSTSINMGPNALTSGFIATPHPPEL
jgi:fatty acid-binding protein DegV